MEINKEKMRYLVNIELQNVLNDRDTELEIAEMVFKKYFDNIGPHTDEEDSATNDVYEHFLHKFRKQLIYVLETAVHYGCCHPLGDGGVHCPLLGKGVDEVQQFPLYCVGECEWCAVCCRRRELS